MVGLLFGFDVFYHIEVLTIAFFASSCLLLYTCFSLLFNLYCWSFGLDCWQIINVISFGLQKMGTPLVSFEVVLAILLQIAHLL